MTSRDDMTDRSYRRDVRGRFVRTSNVPEVDAESRFPTIGADGMDVGVQEPVPGSTIEHPRYAPAGDDLAQGGSRRLRADNPVMVHPEDEGHHNAVLRSAARRSAGRWDDPTAYLVGLQNHGTPANGVREGTPDG